VPKPKPSQSSEPTRMMRPALTPEADENQMVSLAMDLVRQRLIDGTASSQETTHFLKIGSTRERREIELLEKNKELIEAKTQALQSVKHADELYANALSAMQKYSGHNRDEEE